MKKIFKIIPLLLIIFIFPVIVKANTINKIDMDINIDDNGTAHVTEKWSASLDSGTEGYKPYYNIGNAKITNFKVSENKRQYKFQDNWNTKGSFKDKAYKNGINYVSEGLELCFGISKYGNHEYTLNYDIEGFVTTLTDADMIYWTLVPHNLSSKPENVHIKIYSNKYFSDELPVWGYGKYGATAYVHDGYIEMDSLGTLSSNEYMTILVKFDKGTFNTYNTLGNDVLSYNFDYYKDMADIDSIRYERFKINQEEKKKEEIRKDIFRFIILILLIIISPFIINFVFIYLPSIIFGKLSLISQNKRIKKRDKIGSKKLIFKDGDKKLPKDVPNVRDILFNKDVYKAYWISLNYGLCKKKTNLLGAILLKWLLQGKVKLQEETRKRYLNKGEYAIDLLEETTFDNELEYRLYKMLYKSSKDGILNSNEFEKWCKSNYFKILKWFDDVIDYETDEILNEGSITLTKDSAHDKYGTYLVSSSMKKEAIKMKGFKNFLKEFSEIGSKEAIEVNLWEYYLIYAQILGIADRVAKQFKKLYPEVIEIKKGSYSYDDFEFINAISNSSMEYTSYYSSSSDSYNSSSNSSYSSSNRSYTSGGGGFSSGGGGGGSFGGGSGGGGFR